MNTGNLARLQSAYERFTSRPFPATEGSPLPDHLRRVRFDLMDYDSIVAGCIHQLVKLREARPDVSMCRRVLVVNEALSERIHAAPDMPGSSMKTLLLQYKAELDELVRLALAVLDEVQMDNSAPSA